MKVALISVYGEISWDFTIRTLSAVLKKKNFETRLLFLPLLIGGKCDISNNLLNGLVDLTRNTDLIGISVMTNFFSGVVKITQILKKKLNIPIIWGGIHPTLRPEECLDYADMVCIGEGEETVVKLVSKMEKCQSLRDIAGLGYKTEGNVIINNPEPLMQDLDLIPFPDYDCADDYLLLDGAIRKIDKNLLKNNMDQHIYSSFKKYRVYHTITSRGCPFICSYCYNSAFRKIYTDKKIIRKRRIDNIIEELQIARDILPFINCILINDDCFFSRTEDEITEFAEEYKEKIRLPLWVTGLNASFFSKKKFSLIVDAGLKFVRMGIQTGSDCTRRLYKRYYTNQEVKTVTQEINKFRDRLAPPSYDIILDNPWESENDLIKTLMLLNSLPRPYILDIFSLTLYPGTDLYLKAKEEGIIKNDLKEVYNKYYYAVKATYLNKLFSLLSFYSRMGFAISPIYILLLTNPRLRKLKLSQFLYHTLNIPSVLFKITQLLMKGMSNILKGEFLKVFKYCATLVGDSFVRKAA